MRIFPDFDSIFCECRDEYGNCADCGRDTAVCVVWGQLNTLQLYPAGDSFLHQQKLFSTKRTGNTLGNLV